MQDIFNAERGVLTVGTDIQMVYYDQREDAEKKYLKLETNILSFVLHGRKWLYHPRGKMEIASGEGFFLSRGNYLRTERKRAPDQFFASLVIGLSDAYLDGLAGVIEVAPVADCDYSIAWLQQDALITALIRQLVQYFTLPHEKTRLEAVLALKIRELLHLLVSAPVNQGFMAVLQRGPATGDSPLSDLMEAHFREVLSLEQWAFLANHSLSSFKRKFEAAYHMPPRRWIQQRRLHEAYNLLRDRSQNVTEVCFEVGFENLAHFVHLFKERYGVTPKQLQLKDIQFVPSCTNVYRM